MDGGGIGGTRESIDPREESIFAALMAAEGKDAWTSGSGGGGGSEVLDARAEDGLDPLVFAAGGSGANGFVLIRYVDITTAEPTAQPTAQPTTEPTMWPTAVPTSAPGFAEDPVLVSAPTAEPSTAPTPEPSALPEAEQHNSSTSSPAPTAEPHIPLNIVEPAPAALPPPVSMEESLVAEVSGLEARLVERLLASNTSNVTSLLPSQVGVAQVVALGDADSSGSVDVWLPGAAAGVSVPASLLQKVGEDAVVVVVTEVGSSSLQGFGAEALAAVGVSAFSTAGRRLNVEGLREPVRVTLSTAYSADLRCAFFAEDVAEWRSDGLSEAQGLEGSLECATSHFTIFAAVLEGAQDTFQCSQVHLLSADSYAELQRVDEWLATPGAIMLLACLALLAMLLAASCALDARDSRCGFWSDELFLVVERDQDQEQDFGQAQTGVSAVSRFSNGLLSGLKNALDDLASSGLEYLGNFRAVLEATCHGVRDACGGRLTIGHVAASVLRWSATRQACAAIAMHLDDAAFLTSDDTAAELDLNGNAKPTAASSTAASNALEEASQCATSTAAKLDNNTVAQRPPISARSVAPAAASHAFWISEASGRPSSEASNSLEWPVGAGSRSTAGCPARLAAELAGAHFTRVRRMVDLSVLGRSSALSKLRLDRVASLRERLVAKREEQARHHASCRQLLRSSASSCARHGPVGSVLNRSIMTSRALRALLLAVEVLGVLMLDTMFFTEVSGGALGKRVPTRCEHVCFELDAECAWQVIGRFVVVGLASSLLAGIPSRILIGMHSRSLTRVPCRGSPEWVRQLRLWRRQDFAVWFLGLAYCGFVVNYLLLFVANVSRDDLTVWLLAAATALLEDLVLAPLLVSTTVPALAFVLLRRLGRCHHVSVEELCRTGALERISSPRRPVKVADAPPRHQPQADRHDWAPWELYTSSTGAQSMFNIISV